MSRTQVKQILEFRVEEKLGKMKWYLLLWKAWK